jgi:hypothetical protein
MPKEIKQRVVVIADREYPLRYEYNDRRTIERELGKGLLAAMDSGLFEDHITILRVGIAHKFQSITNDKVTQLLQKHTDAGGDLNRPIRQAFWAVIEAGLMGNIDRDVAAKWIKDPDLEPEPSEDDEGKEAPAAVAARSGI